MSPLHLTPPASIAKIPSQPEGSVQQQFMLRKWLTFRNDKSYCHTLQSSPPSLCKLKVKDKMKLR